MQPPESEPKKGHVWLFSWVITFLASLLPTIAFAWANVSEVIDPLRYPWGLTPAELLFLRWFSELAPWIPVAVAALFMVGLYRRAHRSEYLAASTLIAVIYCSLCASHCVIGWSFYLKGWTQLVARQRAYERSETLPREQRPYRLLELPTFSSDEAADAWFRRHSASYRSMAETVDLAGSYSVEANPEIAGGLAWFENGRGHIAINPSLTGPVRFSILLFEVTNLFQESKHQEVAERVRRGELDNPARFALLRESIEFDGISLHYKVLQELQTTIRTIPAEMITWISSTARTFADYQPPLAYDYLKAQEASGHTAHYLKLFEKHRAEFLGTQPK